MNQKTFQQGAGPIAVVAPAAQGPGGTGGGPAYDDTFIRQRLADAESELQLLRQAIEDLGGDVPYDDTELKQRITASEQNIAVMQLAITALEDMPGYDDTGLRDRINQAEQDLLSAKQRLDSSEQTASQVATQLGTIESDISTIEQAAVTLSGRVDTVSGVADAAKQEADTNAQGLTTLSGRVDTVSGVADGAKQKSDTNAQSLATLSGRVDTVSGVADGAKQSADTNGQALVLQGQTLASHGQTLTTLTQAVQTANQKNDAQDLRLSGLELFNSQLLVAWGDSRVAQNWNTNTVPAAPLARSWMWWFELLSQQVRMDVDYMQGVSGDKMSDLLLRIQNDTPGAYGTKKPSQVPPCIAALLCWTNSVNAGVALGQLLIETNQVLDFLTGKGHKVMLIAEWPRGAAGSTDGALTADNQKLLVATHNALLKLRRKNVFIVDVWPRAADPSSTNGYPLPNILNPDNLHNSPGIAMILGQEMSRVARDEMGLPRLKLTTSSNTDQYDAVLQANGCLNTNPMLITPGGVVGANAVAGTAVPLGYTLSASAGLSVAGAFITITLPDGSKRKAYQITISGTPTSANGYASLRQSGLLPKLAVNDIIEGNYEVFVADGHSNFAAPGLMLDTGLAATRAHGGLSITGDNIAPAEAIRAIYGVPRSADLPIGNALPASLSFEMRAYTTLANVAASAVVTILSTRVNKK